MWDSWEREEYTDDENGIEIMCIKKTLTMAM